MSLAMGVRIWFHVVLLPVCYRARYSSITWHSWFIPKKTGQLWLVESDKGCCGSPYLNYIQGEMYISLDRTAVAT